MEYYTVWEFLNHYVDWRSRLGYVGNKTGYELILSKLGVGYMEVHYTIRSTFVCLEFFVIKV